MKYVSFRGRLVIVGFGSIGQGVLPLILRHIDLDPTQITIVTAEERGRDMPRIWHSFHQRGADAGKFRADPDPLVTGGDFLLNVSVNVSSLALIEFCRDSDVLYLDTCIEPWLGGYTDTRVSPVLAIELRLP